jgi:hypothetical protein
MIEDRRERCQSIDCTGVVEDAEGLLGDGRSCDEVVRHQGVSRVHPQRIQRVRGIVGRGAEHELLDEELQLLPGGIADLRIRGREQGRAPPDKTVEPGLDRFFPLGNFAEESDLVTTLAKPACSRKPRIKVPRVSPRGEQEVARHRRLLFVPDRFAGNITWTPADFQKRIIGQGRAAGSMANSATRTTGLCPGEDIALYFSADVTNTAETASHEVERSRGGAV